MSTENSAVDITRYTIISKIGEGNFGIVFRVKDLETGNFFAAKVSKNMIEEETKESLESRLLFREVNLMSLLNHPSILKFVGYYPINFEEDPCPTIITELATNGSLLDIINMENQGIAPDDWDFTKKLISIYGIASGMSYLHANNILHRDLKTANILIDEYLHPKISDFGLSKITDFMSVSMNFQSQKGLKGTPQYLAPEIFASDEHSKASDVYAFAFIIHEIYSYEEPIKKVSIFELMKKILNGYRPEIKKDVPDAYKNLIERCWSQEANERPSFDQIVIELKTNNEFITELVDQAEYFDYIDFIDNYRSTFDVSNRTIYFSDFIKAHGRNKSVKPISFNSKSTSNENGLIEKVPMLINDVENKIEKESKNEQKIIEYKYEPGKINEIYLSEINNFINSSEFNKLSKENQILIEKAEDDPILQFLVGQFFIEETNGFPKNTELGLKFIEESINHKYNDALIYYIKLLIKGKIIQEDLNKASEYISKLDITDEKSISLLNGMIYYKKNKFTEAAKYFEKGSKLGDKECMYKYGKMIFINQGTKKNINEALKQFINSKEKGYEKSEYFLLAFNELSDIKMFSALPSETQLILITNNIKNIKNNQKNESQFDQIFIQPRTTEKLFFNKSLKLPIFYECIKQYKNATIEIEYPSASFNSIFDLTLKIKNKSVSNLNIGIIISSFLKGIPKKLFSKDISYYKINSTIQTIPSEAFKFNLNDVKISIPSSVNKIGKNAFSGIKSLEIIGDIQTIHDSMFYNCSSLTQITISSSVTEIGDSAFYECSSLTQITIPSSVTKIGKSAFYKCSSLTQITIPSSVTEIGKSAFSNCSLLKEIIIPSSVTLIGYGAFIGCSSLTKISISSSVNTNGEKLFDGVISLEIIGDIKVIHDYMFLQCSSLTKISMPLSITEIGRSSFSGCTSLAQIEIPSSVTKIGYSAFSGCSSLAQITIPSSVTEIGDIAFSDCSSLVQIAISPSVKEIGYNVFDRCSSLEQIAIPSSVKEIGNGAFNGCSSLKQITIPSSVTKIRNAAFNGCSSLKHIAIPSSVTKIGYSAFSGCSSLTQIEIPSSVTEIGSGAFNECSSLVQISISSSVKEIGNDVFNRCSSLEQITIPSSVKEIGNGAFNGCLSLKQITIPSSVIKIGDSAFSGCLALTQITIPFSVASIGSFVFSGCSSLKQISIPSSVKEIKEKAFNVIESLEIIGDIKVIHDSMFSNCLSLKQITIPSSVLKIGDSAFFNCQSLVKISIPSSVTEIGISSFNGCSSLKQITIPSSVKEIRSHAFSGCSSLAQIIIPNSVTEIGAFAFSDCLSLTQITISNSVRNIGSSTFSGCLSLTQIEIPDSVTIIQSYSFAGCSLLTQITIPSSVILIEENVFYGCKNLEKITFNKNNRFEFYEDKFLLSNLNSKSDVYDSLLWINANFKEIIIPSFVKIIKPYALRDCQSLTQLTIPSSVTSIEKFAFANCSSLKSLLIPSSVVEIDTCVFDQCTSLKQITFEKHSLLKIIKKSVFNKCSSLTQISIPSSVIEIQEFAFCECSSLKEITFEIPSSLEKIRNSAFCQCSSLEKVMIPSSANIEPSPFLECPKATLIPININII